MNAQNSKVFTTAEPVEKIDNKDIHPVDLHVGARVRMRRKYLGMSQEGLAESIGLTFQQVQKYERGTNRISCSKLSEIAHALKVEPGYFFEGLAGADTPGGGGADATETETAAHAFLMTTEGFALAQTFPLIKSVKLRRRVLEMVTTMAEEG